MADSVNVFPPSLRVTDADGNPVAGAKLKFFEAGTSTPLTVYSDDALTTSLGTVVYCDSAGYPVTAEGGSTKTLIYAGTTDYKLTITDADDVTIAEHDDNPGALDTSGFAVTSAAPSMPVVTRATSSWSVASDAPGTLYRCNVAGSSQTVSFPSAVTAGDGYLFGLQYDGVASANVVIYQTVSGQTITDGADSAASSGALVEHGQTKWFVSDGAGWRVAFAKRGLLDRGQAILVTDRLTAAPASPTAGAIYLINGTPTGTWSSLSFAEHDLVEADGLGGWTRHRPTTDCGWIAYVQDENLFTAFTGTAWADWSNIEAPAQTYQKVAVFHHQRADGTNGGSTVAGSRQTYPLTTFVNSGGSNVIPGVSLATNTITALPVGTYRITGKAVFRNPDEAQLYFYNVTDAATAVTGAVVYAATLVGNDAVAFIDGIFSVDTEAGENFRVEYRVGQATGAVGLGGASSYSDGVEVYGVFVITSLAEIQGPQGDTGPQGAAGDDAGNARLTFNTSTTAADPGAGKFAFDSATLGSITAMYISATDADSADIDDFLATLDDSTSSIKSTITFRENGTPGNFLTVKVDGTATDNTGWWTVPVAYVSGALPSNADSMKMLASQTGDAGVTTAGIVFDLDGGASNIESGLQAWVQVPFACTIQEASLLADTTGSIVIDVWKDTYANYPPTNADSITASAPPTLSSAQKSSDATLTGWTTSVAAGDVLMANVDSVSGLNHAVLTLKVERS